MSIISKWTSGFKTTASKFKSDERGNFTMLFAGASVMFLMAGGLALDTSRMFAASTKLSNAIDAAVLATTRDLTSGAIAEADAEQAVLNFLLTNLELAGYDATNVNIDNIAIDKVNNTLGVDAHMMLPMTLTAVAGWDEVKIPGSTKAIYSDDSIEVAMTLDVTDSMKGRLPSGGSKMDALKVAAQNAVDILITDPTSNRVRVAISPYAGGVNVSPYLSQIAVNGVSNGCVTERTGAKQATDDFASKHYPVNGFDKDKKLIVRGDLKNLCPAEEIVPLTSNSTALKKAIADFGFTWATAGQVGIAWSQYMLSSKWNSIWPAESQAAPTSSASTKKYMIIMTDGQFNTALTKAYRTNQRKLSEKYSRALCDNIKSNDIEVFTINFNGNTNAAKLMKDCASNDPTGKVQHYYDADDADSLKNAFEDIANEIKALRLIG